MKIKIENCTNTPLIICAFLAVKNFIFPIFICHKVIYLKYK